MEFPPKLRPKKGWKQQPEEAPFPVPIQSFSTKPASDSRWFYYSAQLVDGSVIVQSDGDSHFLYKMGFFGKGIFSRGKPEHARMMSSFQGVKRKSLPASERRFQQERFQKVRQHRYEQHLSWRKMKDAEIKAKAKAEKTLTKEESSTSTMKREEEREIGWENVPSTSSAPDPLFYARTASSNDSSSGDKSPSRHLEEKLPSFNSDSGSEVSSVQSPGDKPRVPPQGVPLEEITCDVRQTLHEDFEQEGSSHGWRVGEVRTEREGVRAADIVEENVKKKKRKIWLTDTNDWNIGSETQTVLTKKEENIHGGTDVGTTMETATLGKVENSCERLKQDSEKEVEGERTEQTEVKDQVIERIETDSDRVALGGVIENDSRILLEMKMGRRRREASPENVAKKQKISLQDEEPLRTTGKSEQKMTPSHNWEVNEEEWAVSEVHVTSVESAAKEIVKEGEVAVSDRVEEKECEKDRELEQEDSCEAVTGGAMFGKEQVESVEASRNLPDNASDKLALQRRSSQEEDDDGEEADTEEDVVMEEKGGRDQKSQSKGVKGDSVKHSSKKKTLVRKPDPYPVHEFLQLSYEEAFFLSYGLGCLSLHKYSPTISKGKPMDLCGMWLEFLTLKPRFVATYACYHYYRSKGWVPRCGIKYGCDFVVYRKGPSFYHSSFAVLAQLVSEGSENVSALSSWSRFMGFSRIVENAAKDVVLCFISCPEDFTKSHLRTPACIPHLEVQEIWVKRWCPSRGRTGKDFPSLIS